MATSTFTGPGGGDPVASINKLIVAVQPTEGDVLYGMQRQRSRILKRTGSGVSAAGSQFQAYSPAYAKQKAKYGRGDTVDLRGRNAPHMLQAIVATAGSSQAATGDESARQNNQPCNTATLTFYDDRSAKLAQIHNEGQGHQPTRKFFDASPSDVNAIVNDIGSRTDLRLKALTGK